MSTTKMTEETASGGLSVGSVPERLRLDLPKDDVGCRCPTCHGFYTVTDDEDETVICHSCNTTWDGTFLYPPVRESEDTDKRRERAEYLHSDRAVLVGGYDHVFDEDDDRRPDSVPDEYVFDVSTY